MKCYKLLKCNIDNGILYSVGNLPDRWIIIYPTTRIIYPVDNSKLFVFDTYENANYYKRKFCSGGFSYDYVIWECDGVDITPCRDYSSTTIGIETFWQKKPRNSFSPAHGAMFTSMLKLIRRV